jgi:hypothetical protein
LVSVKHKISSSSPDPPSFSIARWYSKSFINGGTSQAISTRES